MPDPGETPGPRKPDPVRRLAPPAVALARVIVFQLLFASVFAGTVLTLAATACRRHRPVFRAPQHAAQAVGTAAEASLAS